MHATGSHVAAFVQVQLLKERPVGPLIGLTLGLVILFSVEGPSKTCSRVVFDLRWQKVCLILHSATILDQGMSDLSEVLFGTESSCIVVRTPAQWKPPLNYLHCVRSALYTALIICFVAYLDCQTFVIDVAFRLVTFFGWNLECVKGNFQQLKLYPFEFIHLYLHITVTDLIIY